MWTIRRGIEVVRRGKYHEGEAWKVPPHSSQADAKAACKGGWRAEGVPVCRGLHDGLGCSRCAGLGRNVTAPLPPSTSSPHHMSLVRRRSSMPRRRRRGREGGIQGIHDDGRWIGHDCRLFCLSLVYLTPPILLPPSPSPFLSCPVLPLPHHHLPCRQSIRETSTNLLIYPRRMLLCSTLLASPSFHHTPDLFCLVRTPGTWAIFGGGIQGLCSMMMKKMIHQY